MTDPTKDEENGVVVPAVSEGTPLVSSKATNNEPQSGSDSTEGANQILVSQMLEKEVEKPWPATFDRAVGLLTSPIINADRVDIITQSPMPGANPLIGPFNREEVLDSPDTRLFRPASSLGKSKVLRKLHSLGSTGKANESCESLQDVEETARILERKQNYAKAYREKILRQTNKNPASVQNGMKENEKTTAFQCIFNLSNFLLGVAMLTLPFVLKSAGWIGGTLILVFFAFVAWRTSILLARELNGDPRPTHFFNDSPYNNMTVPGSNPNARVRQPLSGFPQIARVAFGQFGNIMLSVIVYVELFSYLCVFLISTADHLYAMHPEVDRTIYLIIAAILLTIPTALLRTPSLLSYLSMAGIFATIAIVVSVLGAAIIYGDVSESVSEMRGIPHEGRVLWDSNGFFIALGLVGFCFGGHGAFPAVFTTMQRPQEFEQVLNYTYMIVLTSCIAVAIAGYWMFGSTVNDQVTISLEEFSGGVATKALGWLMTLVAFSKFTLSMFPLALGIEEIVAPYLADETAMSVASSVIKIFFVGLSLIVALLIPSFGFICALIGIVGTMIVSVIFPAAAHLKLFWDHLNWMEKALDFIFVAFGTVLLIVGLIKTLA